MTITVKTVKRYSFGGKGYATERQAWTAAAGPLRGSKYQGCKRGRSESEAK